ncbi:MAG: hypothetical protein AB1758_22240 [Candidatus Eremiobacterota bacterium]
MLVTSTILPRPYLSATSPPPPLERAPQEEPPKSGEGDDDASERWSRRIGAVGDALLKAPRALLTIPSFLKFAIFDALLPLVGFTAVVGGVTGTVAIGVAGALEVADGIKHRDPVVILGGGGEMARGAYVGSLTWDLFQGARATDLVPGPVGLVAGLVHGGLSLSAGAMRIRRGHRDHSREDKVVGWLEMGMGACALASLALSGPWKLPAVALNGGFAGARSIYLNREKLDLYRRKVGSKAHEMWDKFKALFRSKEPEPAA